MKVPNLFKPEKNLESTTERLLKKEPKPKTEDEFKPAIEKSELEKVLELFDTSYSQTFSDEHLYARIDELIEKSDYKPIKSKKLRYKYWTRQSPYNPEESFIFIKDFNVTKDHHYSFAIVKNYKLEEFYKRFEKERLRVLGLGKYNVYPPLIKGSAIGLILGFIADYAIVKFTGTNMSYTAPGVCLLGVMLGFLHGTISIKYNYDNNRKKLNKCFEYLITSTNKDAVRLAFS